MIVIMSKTVEVVSRIVSIMINGTIKKYEINEKYKIYVEILAGKNDNQTRKLHYQFERDYKVQQNRE